MAVAGAGFAAFRTRTRRLAAAFHRSSPPTPPFSLACQNEDRYFCCAYCCRHRACRWQGRCRRAQSVHAPTRKPPDRLHLVLPRLPRLGPGSRFGMLCGIWWLRNSSGYCRVQRAPPWYVFFVSGAAVSTTHASLRTLLLTLVLPRPPRTPCRLLDLRWFYALCLVVRYLCAGRA